VRDNFGSLVDEVEAGDEIEITGRGKAVAVLLGIGALEALRAESSRDRPAWKGTP
jgi:prevent-host-death family protein